MVDPQEVENKIEELAEISSKCLEDISGVCMDLYEKHKDEFGRDEMSAIAIRSSLTFSVATMIAVGISEQEAHEILNEFYTDLDESLKKAFDH